MGRIADYPALRRPRLKAGVGARSATLIWSITAMVGLLVGIPWGLLAIPVGTGVHMGLRWMFAQDPQLVGLYLVHELVPNNLHAGQPSHGEASSSRPRGYARNLPLQ